jgi:GH15 family glucan-1,4-alpha-glucosidase
LILETTIETAGGVAIVTDFMPTKVQGSRLVRLVRGISGSVTLRTELIIRFNYGSVVPWVRRRDDGSLQAVAGPDRLVLRTPIRLHPKGRTHAAKFDITAGETVDFTLSHGVSYEGVPSAIDPYQALEQTERNWSAWSQPFEGAGQWSEAVIRSLLTLRALIFQPSGGIIAAPTTSLPEQVGGSRNWDYRFCWLRDATFTLLALMNAGYAHEAMRWRAWLVRALGGEPARVQILYDSAASAILRNARCHGFPATPARNRCASAMRRPVSCSSIFMARFSMHCIIAASGGLSPMPPIGCFKSNS